MMMTGDFDAGSLAEMCEEARVIADEVVANEQMLATLVEGVAIPIVEAAYDELVVYENFERLPSVEEMSMTLAKAIATLMPDLVKRVMERSLDVPRAGKG